MRQQTITTDKPLISIIVPVYKVEAYLEQCLDSILQQTWKKLDIILIDDGSPDSCGQICDRYAERDPRVRVFHTDNHGLSSARNLGIKKAEETDSDYLVFIDSDDWLDTDMIETLAETAILNNADVVVCGEYNEYPHKTTDRKYNPQCLTGSEAVKAVLSDRINDHVMNKIWRKQCFVKTLFPDGHVYEDLAINYKIFSECSSVLVVSSVLYHYRNRRDGFTRLQQQGYPAGAPEPESVRNLLDLFQHRRPGGRPDQGRREQGY